MSRATPPQGSAPAGQTSDTAVAVAVKAAMAAGQGDVARREFTRLVTAHQRRALRIALAYLRDAADADEAVQDAFVKAYSRLASYRPKWPFEVWFTRILVNGCLDRLKARGRRNRWMVAMPETPAGAFIDPADTREPGPEEVLLQAERRSRLRSALSALPERQRLIFVLTHFDGRTPREVSATTGLSESTVRVHLFRAIRRLRGLLGGQADTRAAENYDGLRSLP